MRSADALRAALAALFLAGCGGMTDDLIPSGADRRPPVVPGSVGTAVGQTAADFALPEVMGGTVSLYDALAASRGAVLYFTMWCPICDAHMSHMQGYAIPAFPDVRFFAIDYVSGSPGAARAAMAAAGWDGSPFTVLADVGATLERSYSAPMGIVIVDRNRSIRLKGQYDWPTVRAVLQSLP